MEVMEESIRLRLWRGSVPLLFHCRDMDPIRLNVPRMSHLPLAIPKLLEHFKLTRDTQVRLVHGETVDEEDVVDTVPLFLPVGLLYDLFAENRRPWQLTLLSNDASNGAPVEGATGRRDTLMEHLRFRLWNAMKQNEWIRRHSTRRIQDLTPVESKGLSDAMVSLDFIAYWTIAKTFMQLDRIRAVPVRLYALEFLDTLEPGVDRALADMMGDASLQAESAMQRRNGETIEGSLGSERSRPMRVMRSWQDVVPIRLDGQKTTIVQTLSILVARMMVLGPESVDIVCHGVVISWDLVLTDLLDEAQYVDGWLYLVMRPASEPQRHQGHDRSVPLSEG